MKEVKNDPPLVYAAYDKEYQLIGDRDQIMMLIGIEVLATGCDCFSAELEPCLDLWIRININR